MWPVHSYFVDTWRDSYRDGCKSTKLPPSAAYQTVSGRRKEKQSDLNETSIFTCHWHTCSIVLECGGGGRQKKLM